MTDIYAEEGVLPPSKRRGAKAPPPPAPAPELDIYAEEGVVPPSQRREVSAIDAYSRAVTKGISDFNRFIAAPVAGAALLPADIIASLFGAEPGAVLDRTYTPMREHFERQAEAARFKPGENLDLGAQAAASVGGLVGMAPSIALGGPGRATAEQALARTAGIFTAQQAQRAAPGVAGAVTRAAAPEVAASAPTAVVQGRSRASDLIAQGAPQDQATLAGAIDAALTPLMFAAPAAAPGGVVMRGLTGAGANAVQDAAAVSAGNLALDPQYRQEVIGPGTGTSALVGALFGMAGGRPQRFQSPGEIQQMRDVAASEEASAMEAMRRYERFAPILQANGIGPDDPRAPQFVAILEAREAKRAEARAAQLAAMSPEERAMQPEPPGTIVVDPRGRAGQPGIDGTKAGVLSAGGTAAAADAQARGAFGMAGAMAERKQDVTDRRAMGDMRDGTDVSAGGTASFEGSAATERMPVFVLDVVRDDKGNIVGSGPAVEVLSRGERNGQRIAEVGYIDENGNSVTRIVPESRIEQLERPRNPRYTQDIVSRAYSPPEGVGRGDQQPEPRNAAQRITTEESPYSLAGRERPEPAPPRDMNRPTFEGESEQVPEPPPQLADPGVRDTRRIMGEPSPQPNPDAPVPSRVQRDDERATRQPYAEEPIIGQEPSAKQPEGGPVVDGAQASRLRDAIEGLKAEKARLESKPMFERTARDLARLRAIAGEITEKEIQLGRLQSGMRADAPSPDIAVPGVAKRAAPADIVVPEPSRARPKETPRDPNQRAERRPYFEEPIIGGEPAAPRTKDAPNVAGSAAVRLRDEVAALRQERDSLAAVPPFKRTAQDKVRLSAVERDLAAKEAELGRAESDAPRASRARPQEKRAEIGPREMRELERLDVEVPAVDAGTGQMYRIRTSAKEALADTEQRMSFARALWECLHA